MQKAKELVDNYIQHCLRRGVHADAPVLSHTWLREWQLEYGISCRNRTANVQFLELSSRSAHKLLGKSCAAYVA
jgi:hypothetical protein